MSRINTETERARKILDEQNRVIEEKKKEMDALSKEEYILLQQF